MRWWRFLAIALVLSACVTDEWAHVRSMDAPDVYRRFASQNPRSPHAPEALERADFLDLRANPSFEAFEAFRDQHPHSTYLPRAALLFEKENYERARGLGTPAAYRAFLETFPDGEHAQNARAAIDYLAHDGFAGEPRALADFVTRYPGSEFAEEARRALEAADARDRLRFARVALRIEIAAGVESPDRVARTFTQRARDAYAGSPVALVKEGSGGPIDGSLTIRHRERRVATHVEGDTMVPPGVLAETDLVLERRGDEEPVWREHFTLRVADSERRPGTSILFSPRSPLYWSTFFVPVATWPTQLARRGAWESKDAIVQVDAEADRIVALYRDGSFRTLALADPSQPSVVSRYQRPADLATFSGVQRIGDLVVTYGESGVEFARTGASGGVQKLRHIERGAVGAVSAIVRAGDALLLVSSRGLIRLPLAGGDPQRLIDAKLRTLALSGEHLLLVDDQWVYSVPVENPRREAIRGIAKLERGFEPRTLRVEGSLAALVGAKEVMCLKLQGDRRARVLARFQESEIGTVSDVGLLGGRLFVLGGRGLQVVDPLSGRLLDSIDVDPRRALAISGRLVVAAGEGGLQMVDATPWLSQQPAAAAPRQH